MCHVSFYLMEGKLFSCSELQNFMDQVRAWFSYHLNEMLWLIQKPWQSEHSHIIFNVFIVHIIGVFSKMLALQSKAFHFSCQLAVSIGYLIFAQASLLDVKHVRCLSHRDQHHRALGNKSEVSGLLGSHWEARLIAWTSITGWANEALKHWDSSYPWRKSQNCWFSWAMFKGPFVHLTATHVLKSTHPIWEGLLEDSVLQLSQAPKASTNVIHFWRE